MQFDGNTVIFFIIFADGLFYEITNFVWFIFGLKIKNDNSLPVQSTFSKNTFLKNDLVTHIPFFLIFKNQDSFTFGFSEKI